MDNTPLEIWMITDRIQVPDLLENCLIHAPMLDAIVIREKDWSLEETAAFCQSFNSRLNTPHKPKLILNWNGTFDPRCLPIDGIHLGFDVAVRLLDPSDYERQVQCFSKPEWSIGVSLHNKKEWEAVRSLPLQYVMLSNVFETSCKPGKEGLGLQGLESLYKTIQSDTPRLRGYALGGLSLTDGSEIKNLGLHGMVLRSAFF